MLEGVAIDTTTSTSTSTSSALSTVTEDDGVQEGVVVAALHETMRKRASRVVASVEFVDALLESAQSTKRRPNRSVGGGVGDMMLLLMLLLVVGGGGGSRVAVAVVRRSRGGVRGREKDPVRGDRDNGIPRRVGWRWYDRGCGYSDGRSELPAGPASGSVARRHACHPGGRHSKTRTFQQRDQTILQQGRSGGGGGGGGGGGSAGWLLLLLHPRRHRRSQRRRLSVRLQQLEQVVDGV